VYEEVNADVSGEGSYEHRAAAKRIALTFTAPLGGPKHRKYRHSSARQYECDIPPVGLQPFTEIHEIPPKPPVP
jgi:hypothetical protein